MSHDKTVLTEVKSYVVDARSKRPVFRQVVSARVDGSVSARTSDFSLEPGQSFEFEANKVATFSTDFPVTLTMTQTRDYVVPTSSPTRPLYKDPELNLETIVVIAQNLEIEVYDEALPLSQTVVNVTALNKVTGATELIELRRTSAHTFVGSLVTDRGADADSFDGVLGLEHDQEVRISYTARRGGDIVRLFKDVRAISPYTGLKVTTSARAQPNKPTTVLFEAQWPHTMRNAVVVYQPMGTEHLVDVTTINDRTHIITLDSIEVHDPLTGLDAQSIDIITDAGTVSIPVANSYKPLSRIMVPATLPSTDMLEVTFWDQDNFNAPHIDLIVTNLANSAFVAVRVTPLAVASGVFRGHLNIADLNAVPGNTLRVTHVDVVNEQDIPVVVTADTEITIPPTAPETVPDPEPGTGIEFETQSVSLYVDGMFALNGMFPGTFTVTALDGRKVRCSITYV